MVFQIGLNKNMIGSSEPINCMINQTMKKLLITFKVKIRRKLKNIANSILSLQLLGLNYRKVTKGS